MAEFIKLSDFFTPASFTSKSKSLYWDSENDYLNRKNRGLYSKVEGLFDFIYLIKAWNEIVGPLLFNNTHPLKIHHHHLIILVKHPVFAQELKFLSTTLIEKIVARFPELKKDIRELKFQSSPQFFDDKIKVEKINLSEKIKFHPFDPRVVAAKKIIEENLSIIRKTTPLDDEFIELFRKLSLEKELKLISTKT